MSDLNSIRNRFMKESPQMRLGHLAADLLRIANFIESGSANEAKPIFREGKWFAEWIAPEVNFETQQLLANAQSFLVLKEIQWPVWVSDIEQMHSTASTIRAWSNNLLEQAGLATD